MCLCHIISVRVCNDLKAIALDRKINLENSGLFLDPGFFLGGVQYSKSDVTDWWGKQTLQIQRRLIISEGGGGGEVLCIPQLCTFSLDLP